MVFHQLLLNLNILSPLDSMEGDVYIDAVFTKNANILKSSEPIEMP